MLVSFFYFPPRVYFMHKNKIIPAAHREVFAASVIPSGAARRGGAGGRKQIHVFSRADNGRPKKSDTYITSAEHTHYSHQHAGGSAAPQRAAPAGGSGAAGQAGLRGSGERGAPAGFTRQ